MPPRRVSSEATPGHERDQGGSAQGLRQCRPKKWRCFTIRSRSTLPEVGRGAIGRGRPFIALPRSAMGTIRGVRSLASLSVPRADQELSRSSVFRAGKRSISQTRAEPSFRPVMRCFPSGEKVMVGGPSRSRLYPCSTSRSPKASVSWADAEERDRLSRLKDAFRPGRTNRYPVELTRPKARAEQKRGRRARPYCDENNAGLAR